MFRPHTGAFLGAVGDQYTVIDHAEGFMMIDALIQSKDGAHYETAGCFGEGGSGLGFGRSVVIGERRDVRG